MALHVAILTPNRYHLIQNSWLDYEALFRKGAHIY